MVEKVYLVRHGMLIMEVKEGILVVPIYLWIPLESSKPKPYRIILKQ